VVLFIAKEKFQIILLMNFHGMHFISSKGLFSLFDLHLLGLLAFHDIDIFLKDGPDIL
jgi:hypothetical protein